MHLRVNKNEPLATTIKNITPVVYSEFVLKLGDSGQTLIFLVADMLTGALMLDDQANRPSISVAETSTSTKSKGQRVYTKATQILNKVSC